MYSIEYSILGCKSLLIPRSLKDARENINDATPQHQFLGSHLSDIRKELGAWRGVLENLEDVSSLFDAMAGCGFSARVFEQVFPGVPIRLNDLDPACSHILTANFPESDVCSKDVRQLEFDGSDLVFIDFNSMTMRKWGFWGETILKAAEASRILVITDSACYGFHMGNLKAYGVESPHDYYRLYNERIPGKNVSMVADFGNAALVVLEDVSARSPVFLVSSEPIPIHYGPRGIL